MHLLKKIFLLSVFFATSPIPLKAQLATPGIIYAATSDGKIYELNEDFSQKRLVVETNFKQLTSMTISLNGQVYVVDAGLVYRVDLSDGSGAQIAISPKANEDVSEIAFDSKGSFHVLMDFHYDRGWSSMFYLLDPSSGELKYYGSFQSMSGKFDPPYGFSLMTFEPYTNLMYCATSEAVYSRDTTRQFPIAKIGMLGAGFDRLYFSETGGLYLMGQNGIASMHPNSGALTMISSTPFEYVAVASIIPPRDQQNPLAVSPSVLSFGETFTDRAFYRSIFLENRGEQQIEIELSSKKGIGQILHNKSTISIPAKSTRTLGIRVNAGSPGEFADTLTIGNSTIPVSGSTTLASLPEKGKTYFLTNEFKLLDVDTADWSMIEVCKLDREIEKIGVSSTGELFGSDGQDIYAIDATTGKTLSFQKHSFFIKGLCFDYKDRMMLIEENSSGEVPFQFHYGYIHKFDPMTGEVAFLGSDTIGLNDNLPATDIAYSPFDALYVLKYDGSLIRIDVPAGKAAPRGGDFGNGNGFSAAFFLGGEDVIGTCFDYNYQQQKKLLHLNLTTGEVTEINDLSGRHIISAAHYTDYSPVAGVVPERRQVGVYPNPFSGSVTIEVPIDASGVNIAIEVLDLQGRVVKSVEYISKGNSYHATWDGRDTSGNRVPAGIYIVRLQAGNESPVFRRIIYSH